MITIVVPVSSDLRVRFLVESLLTAGLEEFSDRIRVVISLNRPSIGVGNVACGFENKYPSLIKITYLEKLGISGAKNNAIISFIDTTDYFVFIDADCTVHSDYLKKLLLYVEEKPTSMRGKVNFLSRENSYFSQLNCNLRNFTNEQEQILFTPNLILHKSVFEIVGVYDIRMKYGDDLEFDQRAQFKKIHNVFRSDLVIDHHEDPFFFRKTLKTWWGYGLDRGFRVTRAIHINPYRLSEKLKLIVGIRKYWSTNRAGDILFALFYLLVTRLSTIIYMIRYSREEDIYFREYPALEKVKLLS